MLELINKTRASSRVGYLVKAVQGGFEYAGAGDVPIGVVAERVASGRKCKIITNGEAKVFVGDQVAEGNSLMSVSASGGKSGVAYSAEQAETYILIGTALEKGKGLIKAAVQFMSIGATSSGGGSGSIPSGGTTGQSLVKLSATDYDVGWGGMLEPPITAYGYWRVNGNWEQATLWINYNGGTSNDYIDLKSESLKFDASGAELGVSYNPTTNTVTYTHTPAGSYYDGWKMYGDVGISLTTIPSNAEVLFGGDLYIYTDFSVASYPNYQMDIKLNIGQVKTYMESYFYDFASYNLIGEAALDGVGYVRQNGNWVDGGLKIDYSGGTGTYYDIVQTGEALAFAGSGALSVNFSDVLVGSVQTKLFTFSYTPAGSYYDGWKMVGDSGIALTTIPSNGEVTFTGGTYITTNFATASYPNYEMEFNLNVSAVATAMEAYYYTDDEIDGFGFITGEAPLDGEPYARKDGAWVHAGLLVDGSGGTGVVIDQLQYNERLAIAGSGALSVAYAYTGGVAKYTLSYTPAGSYYDGWKTVGDTGTMTLIPSNGELTFAGGTNINTAFVAGTFPNYTMTINLDSNISLNRITLTENIYQGDGDYHYFGAGNDANIVHDGSHFYMSATTGNVYIRTVGTENSIVAAANAGVTLYYNNSSKFATVSGGAQVTGGLGVNTTVTSNITLTLNRTSSNPTIKAQGDTYMIIDSNGTINALNYFVTDNVVLAYGGGDVVVGASTAAYSVASGVKLKIHSGTLGDASNLQLAGNSTSSAVGRITFHNESSTAGDATKRICQIDGGRDSDNDAGYLRFYAFNASGTAYYLLNLSGYAGTAALYYGSSAQKLITASTGVSITGSLTATAEITAYSSDVRLKKDIAPIHRPLDILDGINGVTFSWIDDVEKVGFIPSHKKEHGFIAQNIQRHFPEAVAYAPFDRDPHGNSISGKDYLTVKPEKLIPVLVEAIKELNVRIKQLERGIRYN